MTTEAEREFYYRIVEENAGNGAIVELGAWLGASTAYIAAAIRDSGVKTKAHVYDKFQSKPGHLKKVVAFYSKHNIKKAPIGPCLEQFQANLGDLNKYVEPHRGLIENMQWTGELIAVLITDAPKRVPQISSVLTKLGPSLQPGAIMAWQDFCHFPSYEIPACLYRLRDHLEFVDAIVPGTTLAFKVKSQWTVDEVSMASLALHRWTPWEIDEAWNYWADFIAPEKAELFECGAAMFLCDIGEPELGSRKLESIRKTDAVVKKWAYLREARPDFVTRYAPLFKVMTVKEAA